MAYTKIKPELLAPPCMIHSSIKSPEEYIPFDPNSATISIVQRFELIAARYPENIAVTSNQRCLTYDELNQASNRLARAILDACDATPKPVGFLLEHSLDAVVAILGILKSGNCYMALDASFPIERLAQIIEDTGAPLLLSNTQNIHRAATLAPEGSNVKVINIDHTPKDSSGDNLNIQLSPSDIAYITFTSGTTGRPKGVIRSHENILHESLTQSDTYYIAPSDRFCLYLPLAFEASRACLYGALLNGGALCMFDIRATGLNTFPEWLEKEKITILTSTPSTFRHIFNWVPKHKRFNQLRLVTLGGETATSRDVMLFNQHCPSHCCLVNNMGSSEAGVHTRFIIDQDTKLEGVTIPIGYPTEGLEIFLADDEGKIVHGDSVGEILIKSKYLSPGYWKQPDLTAEKFSADPDDSSIRIFHSGDLGRWHPEGYLYHLGRKDSQIKVRGFRVEVAEIEGTLSQHPEVKDVVILSQPDVFDPQDNYLIAYVVLEGDSRPAASDLREFLVKRLPNYMLPQQIIMLDSLPLTPTGKVDHKALPHPDTISQPDKRPYQPARDNLEARLVKIWERILRSRPIGVFDDYFELGGNSLLAAQLFAQIEKHFHKKLPLASLFEAPTIDKQAAILRQDDWIPNWSSLVALQPKGSKPPIFFAAPVGGNVLSYRDLILRLDPDQPCYGLQAVGLDGVQAPHRNITEIASHYIKEMLSVQPTGPFFLAGSSFGGLVVYEMAQQLHDLGHKLALVAMFDTYGPNYPKRLPGTNRLRRKVFKLLNRIDTHLSNLLYADWRGRLLYFSVKSRKLANRLSRRLSARFNAILHPLPRELRKVRSSHFSAARKKKRYQRQPRRFDGRLVLFRASRQPLGIFPDPLLGWGEAVGEMIEVIEIDGHHTSIIYEPRVHLTAVPFQKILAETQGN